MNIEEIMKPYFDKKGEIEKIYEANKEYKDQADYIRLRLERLRDNKEREISEYLQSEVLNKPGFVGYEAVRKDLENSYLQRETELENQIKSLEENIQNNLTGLEKYHRVDVRELVEVKEQVRKPLIAAKKELELSIREAQINFDTLGLKIARFERKYDENHVCLNGDEFRKLWQERDSVTEQIYNLQQQLKTVNEYITLTELTQEEINIMMMSMTPWEKDEYNRRKAINNSREEIIVEPEVSEPTHEEVEPEVEVVPETPITDEEKAVETTSEIVEPGNEVEENQTVVDSVSELIETIFSDVLASSKKLRSVKISDNEDMRFLSTRDTDDEDYQFGGSLDSEEPIELASGIYLNKKDINKALNNYVKENKGRTFKVKGIDKAFDITKKGIKKVKKSLRECGIIKLLREKKLSSFDLKRVYGKAKTDEYSKMVEIGQIKTTLPTGDYVNVNDFAVNLKNLFVEKSPSWISRVRDKMKKRLRGEPKEEEPFIIEDSEVKKVR